MKNFSQPIKVLNIKEIENKTMVMVGLEITKEELLKYSTNKGIFGNIVFDDGRRINAEQRKKLYATIRDIADWMGDDPNYTKALFKYNFCMESDIEYFSLSDCSLEVARSFINHIIEFVISNGIPLTDLALNRTTEIDSYLFYCLKHSKCSICGQEAIAYTLEDKSKISLCSMHHDVAKDKGLEFFKNTYKVYGIEYQKL